MIFQRWKERRRRRHIAERLYREAMVQARHPLFYQECGVPDTIDGRFDLITLHVFLIIHRVGQGDLSQGVFDAMFRDMDRALRQIGVGDLGVPKRIKKMMIAFNGRAAAYSAALNGRDDLAGTVKRNIYRGGGAPQAIRHITAYVQEVAGHLADQPLKEIKAGHVSFPEIKAQQKAA